MADERKVLAHSAEQIDEAVEKVLDGTVATKTDLQKKADLGEDGKVPAEQVDAYSRSDSISAGTRTALSLPETATPDAALAEIARQLSDGGGLKMDLLWENAAPDSSFAEQTISMDLSGYQLFLVESSGAEITTPTVEYRAKSLYFFSKESTVFTANPLNITIVDAEVSIPYRLITISDTGFYFGPGKVKNTFSKNIRSSDSYLIPQRIFGIKVNTI